MPTLIDTIEIDDIDRYDTNTIEITIPVTGTPVTQGSVTGFVHRGRVVMKQAHEAEWKAWRRAVAGQAQMLAFAAGWDTNTDALEVWLEFRLTRPPSHYGTGRNQHIVKASSPRYPTGGNTGDVDKLARAVLDALTAPDPRKPKLAKEHAGTYADDSQVIDLHVRKRYAVQGQPAGVAIRVRVIS